MRIGKKITFRPRATDEDVATAIAIGGPFVRPDVLSQGHLNALVTELCGQRKNQQTGRNLTRLGYHRFGDVLVSPYGRMCLWLKQDSETESEVFSGSFSSDAVRRMQALMREATC